ncbi:hypothetical protein Tco_0457938 [Tanacetum coccineum]
MGDGMDLLSIGKVRLLFGLYNITGGNCSRLSIVTAAWINRLTTAKEWLLCAARLEEILYCLYSNARLCLFWFDYFSRLLIGNRSTIDQVELGLVWNDVNEKPYKPRSNFTLTFQKRHGSNIPTLFGNSMSNNPDWKSKFIFVKETLISDIHPGFMTDFRHGQGTFSYPYPTEPFDEDL